MKNLILLFMGLTSFVCCIETDEVEDTVSTITILPPENAAVVNSGAFAKVLGQDALLQVEAKSDLGGTFIADPTDLTWSSDDTSIVSIDSEGNLTTVGVGNAVISVNFSSGNSQVSSQVSISVAGDSEAIALLAITSPEGLMVIAPEEQLQLSGTPLNAGGQAVSTSIMLSWSSSNLDVATVTQEGLVTAIMPGEVRITATMGEVIGFFDLIIGTSGGAGSSLTRTAEFEGLSGYTARGDASLETSANGSLSVKIASNFMAQNGPGLYLYLSDDSNGISGGVELGKLKSTQGEQEYDVPAGVTLTQYGHIVLYCKPFGVGFGTAELSK